MPVRCPTCSTVRAWSWSPRRAPPRTTSPWLCWTQAEEVTDLGEVFEVVSEATDLVDVRTALQEAGIDYDSAETSWLPSMEIPLDVDTAKKVIRVVEALEDADDVQNVYTNADIPDEVLAEVG